MGETFAEKLSPLVLEDLGARTGAGDSCGNFVSAPVRRKATMLADHSYGDSSPVFPCWLERKLSEGASPKTAESGMFGTNWSCFAKI